MQSAVASLLREYQRRNRALPDVLLMYRDGVSEGQFARVGVLEVVAIKNACKEINAQYDPKLTFVTVQKCHSTRFFPISDSDSDPKGNLLPGTCGVVGVQCCLYTTSTTHPPHQPKVPWLIAMCATLGHLTFI